LIHTDLIWEENEKTERGKSLHQRTDKPKKNTKVLQGWTVYYHRLRLSAKPDQVRWENGSPIPYEMKAGRTKCGPEDEVQLCACGLALEESTGKPVPYGIIYYWKEKKSHRITFTEGLRNLTKKTIIQVRELLNSEKIPLGKKFPGCRACSLKFECNPQ
jgi:CRISPR-associated exonuclease Cas4